MAAMIAVRLTVMLTVVLAIYGIYFAVLALRGLCHSGTVHRAPAQTAPQKRFAVVIAARNEAAVIGQLVDSLYEQQYPRELFDVIVAPNNCTDETAQVAKAHGATLFLPEGVIRSKGEVLTQVVSKLVLPRRYDAMCVFDADNLADAHFLQHMNDALMHGAQVVQGFRDSKNFEQSVTAGCSSICYWMLNRFYNRGRDAAGLSALVNGSGFAIACDVLEKLGGWHTFTLTEDYEITAQCALAGVRVQYCEQARYYDEQPITFMQSWKQRRRWTAGSVQNLRHYAGLLFEQAILRRSAVCFDLLLTFLMPIMYVVGIVAGTMGTVAMLAGGIGNARGLLLCAMMTLGGLALNMTATIYMAAVTVWLQKKPLATMFGSILSYWLFLLTHGILMLISFVCLPKKWEPITHTHAVSMSQLKKMGKAA